MSRSAVVFVAVVGCTATSGLFADSLDAFKFDVAKAGTGVAYFYIKSNIDGTHASRIAQYHPDADWIESFKWSEDDEAATLVRARMDWKTFSVARFEVYTVDAKGERTLRTTMDGDTEARRLTIEHQGQKMSCDIGHYPWHSYDFDYASLIRTLPHLVDAKAAVDVGRADVVPEPEPHFAFLGLVTVRYIGEQERHGAPCLAYAVDGPALENRGGRIWIDKVRGHLVDYEIALPDEPGFSSGKMMLESSTKMTPAAWAELVRTRKNPPAS